MESQAHIPALAERLLAVLGEEDDAVAAAAGRDSVTHLQMQWADLGPLAKAQSAHDQTHGTSENVDTHNEAQHGLRQIFTPFFAALHASLKQLDRAIRDMDKRKAEAAQAAGKRGGGNRQTKGVKDTVQALHDEVKAAESFYAHIEWLHERFPAAAYEDVTGLCKLASLADIEGQDWSLNPGRYVGVVIEEDGKTEEEFLDELSATRDELTTLAAGASLLQTLIAEHVASLLSEPAAT